MITTPVFESCAVSEPLLVLTSNFPCTRTEPLLCRRALATLDVVLQGRIVRSGDVVQGEDVPENIRVPGFGEFPIVAGVVMEGEICEGWMIRVRWC